MKGQIKVTVIATGFNQDAIAQHKDSHGSGKGVAVIAPPKRGESVQQTALDLTGASQPVPVRPMAAAIAMGVPSDHHAHAIGMKTSEHGGADDGWRQERSPVSVLGGYQLGWGDDASVPPYLKHQHKS